jgi:hypothetical protein
LLGSLSLTVTGIDEHRWRDLGHPIGTRTIPDSVQPNVVHPSARDLSFLDDHSMDVSHQPFQVPQPNVFLEGPVAAAADGVDLSSINVPNLGAQRAHSNADPTAERTQQVAEAAATGLFVSMFQDCFRRPGDLNDYHMEQMMRQAGTMNPEPIQQFSNSFLQQAYSIFQALQSRVISEPTYVAGPDFTFPWIDNPTLHDNRLSPEVTQQTVQYDNTWIDRFPVPEEMTNVPSGPVHVLTESSLHQNLRTIGSHLDFPNKGSFTAALSSSVSVGS